MKIVLVLTLATAFATTVLGMCPPRLPWRKIATDNRVRRERACRKLTKKRVPNIVFVLTDDQGVGDVGYNANMLPDGVPPVHTPVIDRLASEGIKMTGLYMQSTCAPTRAALLTGRLGLRSGIGGYYPYANDAFILPDARGLPLSEVSIGEKLQDVGYTTHLVGKWHLGLENELALPVNRGFDSFVGHLNGQIDHFNKMFGIGGVFNSPRIQRFFAPVEQRVTSYDWHKESRDADGELVVEIIRDQTTYSSDYMTEAAVDIIKTHCKRIPLFLYLAYTTPHAPLQAKQEDMDACLAGTGADFTDKNDRLVYCGMVHSIDRGLAEIEKALKDRNMWQQTILIFASDNGGDLDYGASNGKYRGTKASNYQGGVLVPGFVRVGKRVQTIESVAAESFAGKELVARRQHVDLHTMILDMAGIPTKGEIVLDGLLLPWEHILSNDVQRSELVLTAGYGNFPINAAQGIIIGDFKFLVDPTIPFTPSAPPPGTQELYDLEADPLETTNLIDDPKYEGVIKLCQSRLAYWESQRLEDPEYAYFPSFLRIALTRVPFIPQPEVWGGVVNVSLTGRCHLPEAFAGKVECNDLIPEV